MSLRFSPSARAAGYGCNGRIERHAANAAAEIGDVQVSGGIEGEVFRIGEKGISRVTDTGAIR